MLRPFQIDGKYCFFQSLRFLSWTKLFHQPAWIEWSFVVCIQTDLRSCHRQRSGCHGSVTIPETAHITDVTGTGTGCEAGAVMFISPLHAHAKTRGAERRCNTSSWIPSFQSNDATAVPAAIAQAHFGGEEDTQFRAFWGVAIGEILGQLEPEMADPAKTGVEPRWDPIDFSSNRQTQPRVPSEQ